MSEQTVQKKFLQDINADDLDADEQEPVFMTDRKGIVLVWPDRQVQRFPWSVLRRLTVRNENGVLTTNRERSSHTRVHAKREEQRK
jgi:hypothetical protein